MPHSFTVPTETVSFAHGFSCRGNQLGDVGDVVMVTMQHSIINNKHNDKYI